MRRAVKKILGPIKSTCWTDHSNWTRQQTAENVEPKHLRWLSDSWLMVQNSGACPGEVQNEEMGLRGLRPRGISFWSKEARISFWVDRTIPRIFVWKGISVKSRTTSYRGPSEKKFCQQKNSHSKEAVSTITAFVTQFGDD